MKPAPVQLDLLHPLAMAEVRRLAPGQPARVRIINTRTVAVVNRPESPWPIIPVTRKSRKARP